MKRGQDRKEEDATTLKDVFTTLTCDVDMEEDIRFFARAGEMNDKIGDNPRPLIIGFRNSGKREEVLGNVQKLAMTKYSHISVSTDLTSRQHKEDAHIRREADKIKNELTEEEALNLEWAVVGQRGQRRLIKRRKYPAAQDNRRKRPRVTRGRQSTFAESSKEALRVIYFNARSIISKIEHLEILINDHNPDLILITESWCNENISNSMLNIDGYCLDTELRHDRRDTVNGIGGGLLVFYRNELNVKAEKIDNNFIQYCKFQVIGKKPKNIVVNVTLVYRSPG